MAKRQVDDKIQAKFEKPQFSIEDAVYFSFLGQKQYGYVTKITPVNWVINTQFKRLMDFVTRSVSASNASKPHMKSDSFTSKTPNNSDPQNADEDSSQQEIANRLTQFLKTPEGQKLKAQMTIKPINDISVGKMDANTKRRNSTKNVVKPSTDGVSPGNRKKRSTPKNTELEEVIQKQKDFLNGFVNKD